VSKGRRRVPRQAREALPRELEAVEAAKVAEEAEARIRARWMQRGEAICAAAEQERRDARQKYWATVDPATRLRRVRPFDLSPHHGITREVLGWFEEVKLATLGYLECTILTWDEGRCQLSEGRLGCVASQEDAERLLSSLAAEFPHVPFRIELEEELLENVDWRSAEDVQNAAPGTLGKPK